MDLTQDTTSAVDIVGTGGPIGKGNAGARIKGGFGVDSEEENSQDNVDLVHADSEWSKRGRAVTQFESMANGEYQIRNASDLKKAIQTVADSRIYSPSEVRRFIIKRADALGLTALLPSNWNINLEVMLKTSFPIPDKEALARAIERSDSLGLEGRKHIIQRAEALNATDMLPEGWITREPFMNEMLQSFLVLDGTAEYQPLILEDNSASGGTMKVKVPFYVGESINIPEKFSRKVYFPSSLLSEIISDGKKQIAEAKQPLTVYGRHAHAISGEHLPVGAVVDLEANGRVGYATLEIEPTTMGKDIQVLLRSKKINATSLRSAPGKFEMILAEVNGEKMLTPTKLQLSGIDFAPDNPAMKNYGVEILTAEARVVKDESNKKEVSVDLTLESLRSEHGSLVEKIEKPILDRLDAEMEKTKTLQQEIEALKAKEVAAAQRKELDEYVSLIASKHPKKDEALPILQEIAKDCKTKDEFASKVFPFMLEGLAGQVPTKTETVEEKLKQLFPSSGSGQTLTAEGASTEDVATGRELVGPLEVPV